MNKYLMMSAAAVMASAGVAATGTTAAAGTRVGFSGFCDGFALNNSSGGVIYATKHLYTGCGSGYTGTLGFAVSAKNKKLAGITGFKKFLNTTNSSSAYLGFGYVFQLPLKSGNAWAGFAATNSNSAWEYNAGTYFTGYHHSKGDAKYLKSTTWGAKQKAQQHKSTKA